MKSDIVSEREGYFDALYARDIDPWDFEESSYERSKRSDTISFLRDHYDQACEVGCSIGVLTEELAPRCGRLLGVDIARAAALKAQARLERFAHVEVRLLHLPHHDIDEDCDLLVLSEVLYFLSGQEIAGMADLAKRRVLPGGDVLIVNYDGETQTTLSGRQATDAFLEAAAPFFTLIRSEQREAYHVRLLRRRDTMSVDTAMRRIHAAAAHRDQSGEDLREEVGWLHAAGLLECALPEAISGQAGWSDDPLETFTLLRCVGEASLPVGRLFEGHVNAAQLIALYGEPSVQQRCAKAVRMGALLGVWGADGATPLTARAQGDGFELSGSKAFCSGLGLVAGALVSAPLAGRTHLFYVDVQDQVRMDKGQWQVSGMRATRSGGYDFEAMMLPPDAAIGGPDAYFIEPHFLGGMMRMGAVQLGGLDALLEECVSALRQRAKGEDSLSRLRIGQIASLRAMALASVEHLARHIADQADPSDIAREAVLMREGMEHCIVRALEIAERGLGTMAHREVSAISRLRRDLSFYIRQAAVDDRLMAVGQWHLEAPEQAPNLQKGA